MTIFYAVEDQLASDIPFIDVMLDAAFGLERRVKTSYRLREGNQPVAGLSLVVRDVEGGLAGAISYWPLAVGEDGLPALLLGPLVVHQSWQNKGVGLALLRESLSRAAAKGHKLVLLVGDAPYYARVGFAKVPEGQLLLPGPVNSERFLFLELSPNSLSPLQGLVLPPYRYAEISAALTKPHQAAQS